MRYIPYGANDIFDYVEIIISTIIITIAIAIITTMMMMMIKDQDNDKMNFTIAEKIKMFMMMITDGSILQRGICNGASLRCGEYIVTINIIIVATNSYIIIIYIAMSHITPYCTLLASFPNPLAFGSDF